MQCQSPFTQLDSSQDCKKLYQFLDFCRQKSMTDRHPKIASISLEIDPIDPLAVLCQWADPHQIHFYFENRERGKAIAAIGASQILKVEGSQRFFQAQTFIQNVLDHLISNRPIHVPWMSPRFFSSFTFFEQEITVDSPFAAATIFLPDWQIIRWHDHHVAIAHLAIHEQSNIEQLTEDLWRQFQSLHHPSYDCFLFPRTLPHLTEWQQFETYDFRSAVSSALNAIHHQHLDKLVLAHMVEVFSPLPFQWEHSLHNLRQLHPDCYVFSVGNGKGQSFIGASPERLLSIHNQRLVTDALAGSAPRGRNHREDLQLAQALLGSDKERREHQVVVDFITQQLAQFGLNSHLANAPGLLKLSNIQHLHTPIQTVVPSDIQPLEILAQLHPTPAVAGLPRDIAGQLIQAYEGFARSLYAAPLGWLDAHGNAEFVVGIRSALVEGHRAKLYAGAGIVAGSDPDRELAEVRLKFQALLRALV